MIFVVAFFELVSVLCVAHLLRRRVPTTKKLIWTPLLLLPLVGPLLYGGLFEAPSVLPPHERAPENDYVMTNTHHDGP